MRKSNPDYDIKGFDALYKLVILIKKAFDVDVSVNSIMRYGINEIKYDDIYIMLENGDIKLNHLHGLNTRREMSMRV
ncbi:hypothetical protein PQ743_00230 [Thermoanaerobacterium thermosaccharolyticum]|uniref:hypothetical protein n=1 Tax=Thermoanaerobacterium thermosaccharolyticum TaxID=1517 RepID=UPI0001B0DBE4|nr:hypothetical protein [Thermoanaerobacterium thermosaccharolyticum]